MSTRAAFESLNRQIVADLESLATSWEAVAAATPAAAKPKRAPAKRKRAAKAKS